MRIFAIFAMGAALSACSFMRNHVLSDPRDNDLVTGYRIEATATGATCAEQCNGDFDRCSAGGVDAGEAMACNRTAIDCYASCPDVSTGTSVSAPVTVANARAACSSGVEGDAGYYCFAYWPGADNQLGVTLHP